MCTSNLIERKASRALHNAHGVLTSKGMLHSNECAFIELKLKAPCEFIEFHFKFRKKGGNLECSKFMRIET